MFVIKDHDAYEKFKKFEETKNTLVKERLEEKLCNQFSYPCIEEVFEPSFQQQNEITKTITRGNEDLGKAFFQGEENDKQKTPRIDEILSNLIKSNAVETSITTTLVNLMTSSSKGQFILTHFKVNRFSMNKLNPQNVTIKGSTLAIDNGNRYDLNNYALSYFLSNTKLEKYKFLEKDLISNFCKDLDYDTNHADKISDRRNLILSLGSIRDVEGRGLEIVLLSSDSNELFNRLKLLHQEQIAGNNSTILNHEKKQ